MQNADIMSMVWYFLSLWRNVVEFTHIPIFLSIGDTMIKWWSFLNKTVVQDLCRLKDVPLLQQLVKVTVSM